MTDDPRNGLLALLEPMLSALAQQLGAQATPPAPNVLSTPEAARVLTAWLGERWPVSSPEILAIHTALRRGVADGWLCDRGEAHARFSRLAKPTAATHEFSVDVVSLDGAALEHGHPAGEITLALPATTQDADARFDGHAAGWIVLTAGSRHVPTVTNGRMLLLYALPGGAIAWNPS